MSLLPSHHDQFRSKEYWDRFFLERGGEQFEWYGTYIEMQANLRRSIHLEDRILIIGCGNSEISADLYDNGYKSITNIDFSPMVISEMISKNSHRPQMKWDVGDMTNMPEYADGSYNAVFDKGALDALMSEDTEEVAEKATEMFQEISRVLATNGKYVCITLAEPYILKKIILFFSAMHWKISVESLQSSKPSPFRPFCVIVTKTVSADHDLSLLLDSLGNEMSVSRRVAPAAAIKEIPLIQEYHRKLFELGDVCVGRFQHMDYESAPQEGAVSSVGGIPRFTVTLLDAAYSATRSCIVFFIPSGRESEFQFSTQAGLQGIASEAQCRRLLAVRCNRPHIFPAMEQLQIELSPIATSLKPRDMSENEQIPFMALEADGMWETLEYGRADVSGEYIVEEEPHESKPNGVTRRLVFLKNQNFVQTEIRMIEKSDSKNSKSSGGKNNQKGKNKKGKGDKSRDVSVIMDFDYSYLDDHHKAVLCSMVLARDIINCGSRVQHSSSSTSSSSITYPRYRSPVGLIIGLGGGAMPMCMQRYLPGMRLYTCEMDEAMHGIAVKFFAFRCNSRSHVIISEGMSLIERINSSIKEDRVKKTLTSVDDPVSLQEEAEKEKEPREQLDFLFIDADSKDPSLGLSAPPGTFITPSALNTFYQVLRPGGMLALNVVARTSSLLDDLIVAVKNAFSQGDEEEKKRRSSDCVSSTSIIIESSKVYILKVSDETVNTTLLMIKGGSLTEVTPIQPVTSSSKSVGGKIKATVPNAPADSLKLRMHRENAIEDWLKVINLPSDPLDLVSLVQKLQPV